MSAFTLELRKHEKINYERTKISFHDALREKSQNVEKKN